MRTRSAIFRHAAAEWRSMRADFALVLEATYAKVERDTNGVMLNRDGKREPITAWSLLTGPWSRVERYGSEELIEWFNTHGRPSLEDFEREWWRARNEPEPEPELGPAPGGNPVSLRHLVDMAADVARSTGASPDEAASAVTSLWEATRAGTGVSMPAEQFQTLKVTMAGIRCYSCGVGVDRADTWKSRAGTGERYCSTCAVRGGHASAEDVREHFMPACSVEGCSNMPTHTIDEPPASRDVCTSHFTEWSKARPV